MREWGGASTGGCGGGAAREGTRRVGGGGAEGRHGGRGLGGARRTRGTHLGPPGTAGTRCRERWPRRGGPAALPPSAGRSARPSRPAPTASPRRYRASGPPGSPGPSDPPGPARPGSVAPPPHAARRRLRPRPSPTSTQSKPSLLYSQPISALQEVANPLSARWGREAVPSACLGNKAANRRRRLAPRSQSAGGLEAERTIAGKGRCRGGGRCGEVTAVAYIWGRRFKGEAGIVGRGLRVKSPGPRSAEGPQTGIRTGGD